MFRTLATRYVPEMAARAVMMAQFRDNLLCPVTFPCQFNALSSAHEPYFGKDRFAGGGPDFEKSERS